MASSSAESSRGTIRVNPKTFLNQVSDGRIPTSLVCQQTEELLLQILAKKISQKDAKLASDLLNAALSNAEEGERLIVRLFSLSCQVILESRHPSALKEVNKQVWHLLANAKNLLTKDVLYNSQHVNDVCSQYIVRLVVDANQNKRSLGTLERSQAKSILTSLRQLYDDAVVPLMPDADATNAFVIFYCHENEVERAHDFLRWLIEEKHSHPIDIEPRLMSFVSLISAYGRTNPEKARAVIRWMLDENELGSTRMPPPNSACFNALLDALAKSDLGDAGQKAEQTLDWMRQLHETKGIYSLPDEISFNSSINAWAKSSHPDAAPRAEALLHQMTELHENGSPVCPSNVTFTSVMDAWANSGREESPTKIAGLLDLMQLLSKTSQTLNVNSYCYSILIKAWVKVAQRKERGGTQIIDAILSIAAQMDEDGIEKTSIIHNSIIMGLLESSPATAILYFLELEESHKNGEVSLDTRTFNSAISAVAALNKPDTGARSLQILYRMLNYSNEHPHLRPDETTYNVVLKALSRSNDLSATIKAGEILDEMEKRKLASSASYVPVIMAWGRCQVADRFDRIKRLLQRHRQYLKGGSKRSDSSIHVYNAALSVCQHNRNHEEREATLDLLRFCLHEIEDIPSLASDQNTYVTLFRAIGFLLADKSSHDKLLLEYFERCIDDGYVSGMVLSVVYEASRSIFETVTGKGQTPETVDIPRTWSRSLRRRS